MWCVKSLATGRGHHGCRKNEQRGAKGGAKGNERRAKGNLGIVLFSKPDLIPKQPLSISPGAGGKNLLVAASLPPSLPAREGGGGWVLPTALRSPDGGCAWKTARHAPWMKYTRVESLRCRCEAGQWAVGCWKLVGESAGNGCRPRLGSSGAVGQPFGGGASRTRPTAATTRARRSRCTAAITPLLLGTSGGGGGGGGWWPAVLGSRSREPLPKKNTSSHAQIDTEDRMAGCCFLSCP